MNYSAMIKDNITDVSLFLRSDYKKYLSTASSKSGDLFDALWHHGPAVENEWMALRLYFNYKTSIDLYSKSRPGLELRETCWYTTPEQEKNGWGADYYIVGETVGLGGVRLWDGQNVKFLDPVTNRMAVVNRGLSSSYMEMISEGILYNDKETDIMVRVTVFSGKRDAMVEAFALTNSPVQFVTGLNYHDGVEVVQKKGLIATWGVHPPDIAAEPNEIGAAVMYCEDDFIMKKDDGKQILLISKPARYMKTSVSSANAREPKINTLDRFLRLIDQ